MHSGLGLLRRMVPKSLVFPVVLIGAMLVPPLYAYVDPNATGLISQIAGPILVVAATGVTFLRKQISTGVRWLVERVRGK